MAAVGRASSPSVALLLSLAFSLPLNLSFSLSAAQPLLLLFFSLLLFPFSSSSNEIEFGRLSKNRERNFRSEIRGNKIPLNFPNVLDFWVRLCRTQRYDKLLGATFRTQI